jgi:uncharacterized protein YndB with AHSA1/START domain
MLTFLKIAGLALLAVIAIVLIYTATRPDQFRITRQVIIKAPTEVIFAHINDLRQFNTWNPFATADLRSSIAYGATSAGVGGSYSWDSSRQSNKGRMEITAVDMPRRVEMCLHFDKPMNANNDVVFLLQPRGDGTEVSWQMSGTYGFVHKAMGLIFNFDKMVGGEFDKGLAQLKSRTEAR